MIKSNNHMYISYLWASIICLITVTLIFPVKAQENNTHDQLIKEDSVVGLIYHRFGENKYPATSVSLEQLDMQINALTSGKYNVIPLITAVNAMLVGKKLPPRSIVITVDDAFTSFYEYGWPKFKAANLPVTLFLTTFPIDNNYKGLISWDNLRKMKQEGLDIQAHSHNHYHLTNLDDNAMKYQVKTSQQRIKQELGINSKIFAYPYGEASSRLMKHVKNAGFIAAFGQHSGGMTSHSNKLYLPRFPINMSYGNKGRFQQVINSIGLPVADMMPVDPSLQNNKYTNPPSIGFTIAENIKNTSNIACYHSKIGMIKGMQWLGQKRIELRFSQAFNHGRTRINCTIPAKNGRWYWLGMQYYVQ